jgi:hypothetical protein
VPAQGQQQGGLGQSVSDLFDSPDSQQQPTSTGWQDLWGNSASQDAMKGAQAGDSSWWDQLTGGGSGQSSAAGGSGQSSLSGAVSGADVSTLDGADSAEAAADTLDDSQDVDDDQDAGELIATREKLGSQMQSLYLSTPESETSEGRFLDPKKAALANDIGTFGDDVSDLEANWDSLSDQDHQDRVMALEDTADELSTAIQDYKGPIDDYDKRNAEKIQLIASAMKGIQGQVANAVAILRSHLRDVTTLQAAIDNEVLGTEIHLLTAAAQALLDLNPITAVISLGASIIEMGSNPTAQGGVEVAAGVTERIAEEESIANKAATCAGSAASIYGVVAELKESSEHLDELYERLETAASGVDAASKNLGALAQQAKAKAQQAVAYASAATGIDG